jgi:branched-chain amino acid transport system substrate-binding protein
MKQALRALAAALLIAAAPFAAAQRQEIVIGAVLSLTGPGASLGIPERNTIELLPTTIAGRTVRYVVLDDATDTTAAVRNARKLVTEDRVDAIIGPTVTPTSLALLEVIGPAETPMISLAGSGVIAYPVEGNKRWSFKLAPNEPLMAARVFEHATSNNVKTIAYIAFANAFGESFTSEMRKVGELRKVQTVAHEKFNPTDTSVTPQVLKVISLNPDAVLIAASGTPAATPVIELRRRGYKGIIYLNQGVANNDFLRVGGKELEGALFSVSPVLVAEQLPDSNPIKKVAMDYVRRYEAKFGPGSRSLFGATAWDAWLILERAIPIALKSAQPGTVEFRRALRDAIEQTKELIGTQAVFNLSPTDHSGGDQRGQVLVQIRDGKWKLVAQ